MLQQPVLDLEASLKNTGLPAFDQIAYTTLVDAAFRHVNPDRRPVNVAQVSRVHRLLNLSPKQEGVGELDLMLALSGHPIRSLTQSRWLQLVWAAHSGDMAHAVLFGRDHRYRYFVYDQGSKPVYVHYDTDPLALVDVVYQAAKEGQINLRHRTDTQFPPQMYVLPDPG